MHYINFIIRPSSRRQADKTSLHRKPSKTPLATFRLAVNLDSNKAIWHNCDIHLAACWQSQAEAR